MPALRKNSIVLVLSTLLTACAGGAYEEESRPNFYADRLNTPAAKAFRTPGTNGGYARTLSCDQIAIELNTLGREMGQVATNHEIYTKGTPNNLQLAQYITSMYDTGVRTNELKLSPRGQVQIERLINDYHSLRFAAYEQRCPVTASLDEADQWVKNEYKDPWRRFDKTMEFLDEVSQMADDVKTVKDEVKDW